MRKLLIGTLILGTTALAACEDKASTPAAAPSASAAPSAAPSAATSTTAAPPKAPEGPKDHVARAKAMVEAFAAHDPKKLAALYAVDAVVKTPGMPDVKGRDAIEKEATQMFGIFKDAKLTTGRIWEKDKHTAVIEQIWSGTNTGDAPDMGLPKATNKPAGVSGASWIEAGDDGFIKEEHRYHDMPTVIGQLKAEDKKDDTKKEKKEKKEDEAKFRPVMTDPPAGTKVMEAKSNAEEAKKEEAKNLEFETKWVAALSGGKMEEMLKLADKEPVVEDYTEAAAIKGEKPFKEYLEKYLKAFPDMKATITRSFGEGEFAIVEFEYTGTNKGPLGTLKATNKPIDVHQVEVDEIKDGKLVHAWAWGNSAEMLSEMGLIPAPGTPAPASSGKK